MTRVDGVPDRTLVDRFGRIHTSLRIGITDRCNLRCRYCMPEQVAFLPRAEILTFEEIERFARVAASIGVRKLRITGGEPLVRRHVCELVARLASIKVIDDLALTTNGLLLAEHAESLQRAGLKRINISLDTVRRDVFAQWTRRDELPRVLEGIAAAKSAGFEQVRLNALAIREMTEDELVPLVEFARAERLELRFIEFMPIDADQLWNGRAVLPGSELRRLIEVEFGPLTPIKRLDPSQPAADYQLEDGTRIGLICSVTEPFCAACNRLRLTAKGQIRNCLFSQESWDVRSLLRSDASDEELCDMMRACVGAKRRGHGSDDPQMLRPDLAMYQIGG